MHAAPADGRGQVVDVAHELAVAVRFRQAERARLEEGIGTEEVALGELDLIVRVVAEQPVRVVEVDEVVATPLEHAHRPTRGGEHVGRGRTPRPRPDDDGVELGHQASATSSSG